MTSNKPDFNLIVDINERVAEPLTFPFGEQALALANVSPGERVIDVAAGTGATAVAAARLGAHVIATDIAAKMVARAADRLRPFPASEARAMASEALDMPDAAFDVGLSLFGITLFTRWREGLAELSRVTRPGGRVVLATWIEPEGAEPMVLLRKAMKREFPQQEYWPGGHLNEWTDTSLAKAMEEAGCNDVKVHRHSADFRAGSIDRLRSDLQPIYGFGPGYASLTEQEREQLWASLLNDFASYGQSDGSIRLPSPGLIAVGRKAG